MEPVELSADGVLLRAWQPEDTAAIHVACQDPLIQRWTNVPVPYLRQHAERLVDLIAPRGWSTDRSALFGVFDATTGALLGSHGLTNLDRTTGVGELGTWVAPWARSAGVAERATRAVARWALDVLDLRQLMWNVEVGNHASRLVGERVGFAFDAPARGLITSRDNDLRDGWRGTLRPGEIRQHAPSWFARGGPGARRAHTFGSPQPEIDGGAVTLRALAEDDIEPIVTACTDPDAIRWTNIATPFTLTDAASVVRVFAPGQWSRGEGGVFAVAGPDGRYAGRIDLHISRDDQLVGSVGYMISPHARGQGYATAAVRAICAWGFDALGIARIEWRAHLGNHASRRVAQKAGFIEEGIARAGCAQRGERRDAWMAALLAA